MYGGVPHYAIGSELFLRPVISMQVGTKLQRQVFLKCLEAFHAGRSEGTSHNQKTFTFMVTKTFVQDLQ